MSSFLFSSNPKKNNLKLNLHSSSDQKNSPRSHCSLSPYSLSPRSPRSPSSSSEKSSVRLKGEDKSLENDQKYMKRYYSQIRSPFSSQTPPMRESPRRVQSPTPNIRKSPPNRLYASPSKNYPQTPPPPNQLYSSLQSPKNAHHSQSQRRKSDIYCPHVSDLFKVQEKEEPIKEENIVESHQPSIPKFSKKYIDKPIDKTKTDILLKMYQNEL
jgi:hypothetical protein